MKKKGGEDPQAEMRARIQKLKGKSAIPQPFAKSMINESYEEKRKKSGIAERESYEERRTTLNAGIAEREKADLIYHKGVKSVRITSIDIPFGEIFWLTLKAVIASMLVACFIGLIAAATLGVLGFRMFG